MILLAEDEQSIADTIIFALEMEGFKLEHTMLGQAAIELAQKGAFELLILDVGLPDLSGFEVCKKIRSFSQVPVIFLTARDSEIDRIVGLEIGADDYVTKPFSPRELAARVKVILKRVQLSTALSEEANSDDTLDTKLASVSAASFEHKAAEKQFYYQGELLSLTRYEYGLMLALFEQPERVFSREQLLDKVWPDHCGSLDRVIDTHIKSLRQKLKKINSAQDPIQTHRGFGYSLRI